MWCSAIKSWTGSNSAGFSRGSAVETDPSATLWTRFVNVDKDMNWMAMSASSYVQSNKVSWIIGWSFRTAILNALSSLIWNDKLRQELDDAQKVAGDRNTTRSKFGQTRAETLERRLEGTERDLKWHHILLHRIEQQRLAMDLRHPTPVKGDHEDQDTAPKAVRRTSTRGRRTKQTEGPSVLGKVRVTKAKSSEWNTRNTRIQKPKVPELEAPIQNLDVILQSNTSKSSQHSETKPRRTKIDRPLRQIHPQSVSKASRFAGIRVKSPSGPRRRVAKQTQSPDQARRPTPQRAQSAPTITTRSGRISRPLIRWGS